MSKDALISWDEVVSTRNGSHSVDDCLAVDVGFGNLISALVIGMRPGNDQRHGALRQFLARPPASRVLYCSHGDPTKFMKDLLAKGDPAADGNTAALPVVFFTRDLSSSVHDGSIYKPIRDLGPMQGKDGRLAVRVNLLHEVLTYQVFVVGWDRHTADWMRRYLSAMLRHHVTGFAYETVLLDGSIDASADVVTKTPEWQPQPLEDARLVCLSTSIEVIAEVYEAAGLDAQLRRYRLLEPRPMFGMEG
ncbi:MAG: hypothetical protein ACRDC0_16680 [Aeromonas veronii]